MTLAEALAAYIAALDHFDATLAMPDLDHEAVLVASSRCERAFAVYHRLRGSDAAALTV